MRVAALALVPILVACGRNVSAQVPIEYVPDITKCGFAALSTNKDFVRVSSIEVHWGSYRCDFKAGVVVASIFIAPDSSRCARNFEACAISYLRRQNQKQRDLKIETRLLAGRQFTCSKVVRAGGQTETCVLYAPGQRVILEAVWSASDPKIRSVADIFLSF